MLDQLVALIAPPACGVCGDGCDVGLRLCERCESALRRLAPVWSAIPGIDRTWSAAPYDGGARELVAALKFGARVGLAELLAGTIVPVPPAPLRRRQRGFDSADAIAMALARRTGLPLIPCLARTHGRRQVGRRRSERLADPPMVSAVSPVPAEAILVDDVMTTGATLGACAEAIRSAGAIRVVAVTLAASRPVPGPLGIGASRA